MAPENEQARVVTSSGSLYTILLAVSAFLLAAAAGLLLYWQNDFYNYILFFEQTG